MRGPAVSSDRRSAPQPRRSGPGRGSRPGVPGPVGILHPFPSLLDGLATGLIALVAGGALPSALMAGIAMTVIQTSIGATNDLCDIEHDRVARPRKVLASGLITPRLVATYAVLAAVAGLAIALRLGSLAVTLAAAGLAVGLVYDVWLNRTRWSWVPYAVGLPLLAAFAWSAARGTLPPGMPALMVLGAVAGAALSIGNGLVDLDDDAAAGRGGLAFRLGAARAWGVLLVLYAILLAVAAVDVVASAPGRLAVATLSLGAVAVAAGAFASRSGTPPVRERAWEVQGIGVVLVALAWLVTSAR